MEFFPGTSQVNWMFFSKLLAILTLMFHHSGGVNGGQSKVHIRSYSGSLMFIFCLQFPRFGSSSWGEVSVQSYFKSRKQFVVTSSVEFRVLSVLHFFVKVRPRSFTLYFVSKFPVTLPLSRLETPPVMNSTPVFILVSPLI